MTKTIVTSLIGLTLAVSQASAALVPLTPLDNWVVIAKPNANTVVSGTATNTPSIAEVPATTTNAIGGTILGGNFASAVTLEIGEKLIVTGDVTFHTEPAAAPFNNFGEAALRVALLDRDALPGTNAGGVITAVAWDPEGYVWDDDSGDLTMAYPSTAASDANGSAGFWRTQNGNFSSTSSNPKLTTGDTETGTGQWEGNSVAGVTWNWEYSIERTGATTNAIRMRIWTTDPDARAPLNVDASTTDPTVGTANNRGQFGSFTFKSLGWVWGGSLPANNKTADSAEFSPINYQVVPEPASLALLGLGGLLVLGRRRRA